MELNIHKLGVLLEHWEACLRDEAFAIAHRNLDELEQVLAQKAELLSGIQAFEGQKKTISSLFPDFPHRIEAVEAQQQANVAAFNAWTEASRVELADIRRATVHLRQIHGPMTESHQRSTPALELWG